MFSTLISTDQLAARIGTPNLIVCDVRHDLMDPDDWGAAQFRIGHVPGAVFVHLDRDLSAPTTGKNGRHPLPAPETAARLFARLGIGSDTQVVVYDQGPGMYAARLWWMLRWLGFDHAAVLDGGYAKWQVEGRAVTTEISPSAPADFLIRRVAPTVDASGIMASLAKQSLLLVDARAPARFRGESEPLDPVAGHIPGSRNRPFTQNLNPDGTFKHAAFLRAEFGTLLGDAAADLVVHLCGSGVTACHNALAMELAGFAGTRMYPGSWSEWCSNPERPVAVGDEDQSAVTASGHAASSI
ncbi:MAG: sulfurtransferase [Burkholderiales bacterium]|nr:sulfurtransferase [Burkholderiales bacterium]